MKVFLMYPDRDFDPGQKPLFDVTALTQDLELNTLFEAMAQGDKFLYKVAQQVVLSGLDDADVILYRQEILKDCLRFPELVRQIYSLPVQAMERKQRRWMGIFSHYPGAILGEATEMLDMYVELLKVLKQIARDSGDRFESRGFRRFFTMLQQELDDEYFDLITDHLKTLKFQKGILISAELGQGNEGTNYVLRKPNPTDPNWMKQVLRRKSPVYSYTLQPRDDHGARALSELRDRGINLVANAVAQSADHVDSFFKALQLELAFYIGCLNLAEQLAQLGEPIAFPQPAPFSEPRLSCTGLYDVTLALTMKQKVVGNDVAADNRNLLIITGANQGGKTTFLRALGLAQLMMQCGMFVPGEAFSANLCHRIFTHFKREEDESMQSGKLDEELSRMSEIVNQITPNSLMLFNESFAATNEREGSEIARQVTRALLEKRIKVYFVTHLYDFARSFYEARLDSTLFLRAERKEDGERTFKLIEGEPLQTSYGGDVYRQIFSNAEVDQPEIGVIEKAASMTSHLLD